MRMLFTLFLCLTCAPLVRAQGARADKYRPMIDKALHWLVQQQEADGSWSKDNNGFATATTAFAGMALMADGHTLSTGKYAPHLRQAFFWFLAQRPKDARHRGLLGNDPNGPGSSFCYMPQHGVAMSFLAKLYGETEDKKERTALRDLLRNGVAFSVKGQAATGGWFYTSTIEGHNATENVATMLVLQGLIDARNAGIPVPTETLRRAYTYLQGCTTPKGGIVYSAGPESKRPLVGGERPTITAMALAAYSGNGPQDETQRRWLKFCAGANPLNVTDLKRYPDFLPHYYFSKVVYHLDEKATRALFPDKKIPQHLIWAKYRTALFDYLQSEQTKDGHWPAQWTPGRIFNASLALNILLYENSVPFQLSR
ncbi:MAG: terpene cyclase/mutase family protein [Planctomycetes bacterium]|nr:terpene cyclase/mutase family protein [Planctomycetota bacterium]